MATVYDKDGKGYEVPHQIDVDEWLKSGDYSLDKSEDKKPKTKKEELQLS